MVPSMLKNKAALKSIELNGNCFDGEGACVDLIREQLSTMEKDGCLDELDEMEEEEEEVEFEGEDVEETLEQLTARLEGKAPKSDNLDDLAESLGKVDLKK